MWKIDSVASETRVSDVKCAEPLKSLAVTRKQKCDLQDYSTALPASSQM